MNCNCHCHNDHEGFGLSNKEAHCKCLPNCEHCNPYYKSPELYKEKKARECSVDERLTGLNNRLLIVEKLLAKLLSPKEEGEKEI